MVPGDLPTLSCDILETTLIEIADFSKHKGEISLIKPTGSIKCNVVCFYRLIGSNLSSNFFDELGLK